MENEKRGRCQIDSCCSFITTWWKIRTVKEGRFLMETGADSIVTRKIKNMSIIEELE